MEINKKIESLNTYELITKFLQRPGLTSHISKHLSSATMKPVDGVFSSVIDDSFIILLLEKWFITSISKCKIVKILSSI